MATLREALANRDEYYNGWTADELKADAKMDLLRLLNVLTDIESPSAADFEAIHHISEAIDHLHCDAQTDECTVKRQCSWSSEYPSIAEKKKALDDAFTLFMMAKAADEDASELLSELFEAHTSLAKAVMSMSGITDAERKTILAAIKK